MEPDREVALYPIANLNFLLIQQQAAYWSQACDWYQFIVQKCTFCRMGQSLSIYSLSDSRHAQNSLQSV